MAKQLNNDLENDFLQLARIALAGRAQDLQLVIHKASKKLKTRYPDLSAMLVNLLQEAPTRSSPLRRANDAPLPVDIDSRLQLLKVEAGAPEHEPVLSEINQQLVEQIVNERNSSSLLSKVGLQPTKSLLFTGPPGVGKTLTAKWIAAKLDRPLLLLDLAAVMSSFLGRTGNNIRFVLDYAKSTDCVLLIDELDSVAKRRDDNSEVGELKRLVNVLLQEIDDWPASGLLICATNHPDLLDPAIWRRFDMILEFAIPGRLLVKQHIESLLNPYIKNAELWSDILSFSFHEKSFSDIEKQINQARRASVITNTEIEGHLQNLVQGPASLSKQDKIELASLLLGKKIVSQRKAQEITGLARETIRKNTKQPLNQPLKRKK